MPDEQEIAKLERQIRLLQNMLRTGKLSADSRRQTETTLASLLVDLEKAKRAGL